MFMTFFMMLDVIIMLGNSWPFCVLMMFVWYFHILKNDVLMMFLWHFHDIGCYHNVLKMLFSAFVFCDDLMIFSWYFQKIMFWWCFYDIFMTCDVITMFENVIIRSCDLWCFHDILWYFHHFFKNFVLAMFLWHFDVIGCYYNILETLFSDFVFHNLSMIFLWYFRDILRIRVWWCFYDILMTFSWQQMLL